MVLFDARASKKETPYKMRTLLLGIPVPIQTSTGRRMTEPHGCCWCKNPIPMSIH